MGGCSLRSPAFRRYRSITALPVEWQFNNRIDCKRVDRSTTPLSPIARARLLMAMLIRCRSILIRRRCFRWPPAAVAEDSVVVKAEVEAQRVGRQVAAH